MTKASEKVGYFGRQSKIWLGTAAVFLVLCVVFWANSDAKESGVSIKHTKPATVMDSANLPAHIESLDELQMEVPPVNFESITRDMRNYPAEFKDKSYFNTHRNKWTVQVMDVAEHKVIVDYLNGRGDRDKFAYFRYKDKNDKIRYILTYGVMNTFKEAAAVSTTVQFHLPNSTRVAPEEMKRYISMIDSYQRMAEVVNIREEKPRQVNLKQTDKEVAAKAAEVSAEDKAKAEELVKKEQADSTKEESKPAQKEAPKEKKQEVELATPPTIQPVEEAPEEKKGKLSKFFKKDKSTQSSEDAASNDTGNGE